MGDNYGELNVDPLKCGPSVTESLDADWIYYCLDLKHIPALPPPATATACQGASIANSDLLICSGNYGVLSVGPRNMDPSYRIGPTLTLIMAMEIVPIPFEKDVSISVFSDQGPPRCYVLGLIFAILCGDNNSIDSTNKTRAR